MAITIRVYKRLDANGDPIDEVSYNGDMSNPAYFSVAVVPVTGKNYAPDEEGLTLYVKLESTGDKGLDLKVKAVPLNQNQPPSSVLDSFEAYEPIDENSGEWKSCYQRYVTVTIPGQVLNPNSVHPVKLRVGADPGDPVGMWQALLHFIVYNIGS